ncbi:uncharacterized protein DDB_G0292186-like [Anastrepha ludens]|uniref:uncharacterized protein DDB_G0292186-like n=1 Tax=Anastrepha ludens TaxID=28586 RepID=UPI0023B160FF|nr:uncharacterized protein DDB_G0292186-like [Anastrepha ludens]
MTQAGIARTPITTTKASTHVSDNTALFINLCANSSSSCGNTNNNKRNNNNNKISNKSGERKSKYLTWYKIVTERSNDNNNSDHYIYKGSSGYGNDYYNYNNEQNRATTKRDEQIGNVDGNGSVLLVHTGNANKNRIRKSKKSFYSVNKIVLATNGRTVSRRRVNKSVVNSVNNKSSGRSQSFQVKRAIAKGDDFSHATSIKIDGQVEFSKKALNINGSASFSKSSKNNSERFFNNQFPLIFSNGFSSRAQILTRHEKQLQAKNNSTTIRTATERTTSTHFDYIVITDYNRPRKRTFWQKYGE